MQIREAGASDLAAIRQVHLDAFGDHGETVSDLAVALIGDDTAQPLLALVAEADGDVVGSVIFSTVHIRGAEEVPACILAPLAVAEQHRRKGIGGALVESGLDALRQRGVKVVFVLGDPHYYRRHGFSPNHRVRAPYDLPYPEAWMAIALQGNPLDSVSGRLVCPRSLSDRKHW